MRRIAGDIVWSLVVSVLVAVGGTVLLLVGMASAPWGAPAVLVLLFMYWRVLGGEGPRWTSALRRAYLRARPVSPQVVLASLAAGGLGLVALAGAWVACVELFGDGGNPTVSPELASASAVVAVPAFIIASLVVSTTEEAAFRGYALVRLERSLPGGIAVVMSSVLFALWHGPTQGMVLWKIAFFFLVGVLFGTIALLTRSTLPALPVHFAGDVVFFTIVWPGDALRHGVDAGFPLAVAQAAVAGTLALLALVYLARLAGERPSRLRATTPPPGVSPTGSR